jgi:hypothetical protein
MRMNALDIRLNEPSNCGEQVARIVRLNSRGLDDTRRVSVTLAVWSVSSGRGIYRVHLAGEAICGGQTSPHRSKN